MSREAWRAEARNAITFSLGFGLLGLFITFVPGGEAWWYGIAAVLAALGLRAPQWRLVAAVLLAVWVAFAWLGYQRGERYQEWLREEMPRLREQLQQRNGQNAPAQPPAVP